MQFKHLFSSAFFLLILSSQSLAANINPVKELFDQATAAYSQGDYQKAIEFYEKSLKIYPNFAPAYNFLGLCHKATGSDTAEVISLFRKAIAADPNYTLAYENLAKTYYSLGEYDEAEKSALKALEIDPELMTSQLTLGWIYLVGKSQPGDAIERFRKVLKSQVDMPYAYFGLGMSYFMDHQSFKALEMITRLRQVGSEDLANQLEIVIRSGQPPSSLNPNIPIAMPQRQQSVLVSDNPQPARTTAATRDTKDGMQVLLRGKMPRAGASKPY